MQHAERLTLAEMREFLAASNTLSFAGAGRRQIYGLVERTLRAQQYLRLSKGLYHINDNRLVLTTEPFLWFEGVLQQQDNVTSVKAEQVRPLADVAKLEIASHDFH